MEKRPHLKQLMTVLEFRAFAEGLAKRANRVTSGRKQVDKSRLARDREIVLQRGGYPPPDGSWTDAT